MTKMKKKTAVMPASGPSLALGADPTVQQYMHAKRQRMGERGGDAVRAGKKPRAEDIREAAIAYAQYRIGQGLHEWIPTNMGATLAAIPDPVQRDQMAQAQEGLRSTPAMTPMRSAPGTAGPASVGGHTGTYINELTGGSTNTSVQKQAHDHLRQATLAAIAGNAQAESLVVHMTNAQLEITPHGRQLVDDASLTGAVPNRKVLGALETPATPAGPNRVAHAQEIHEAREEVKARGRALVRSIPSRGPADRSPSPERHPINADGSGGHHIAQTTATSRVALLPHFSNPNYQTYLQAEWVSQPMRARRK